MTTTTKRFEHCNSCGDPYGLDLKTGNCFNCKNKSEHSETNLVQTSDEFSGSSLPILSKRERFALEHPRIFSSVAFALVGVAIAIFLLLSVGLLLPLFPLLRTFIPIDIPKLIVTVILPKTCFFTILMAIIGNFMGNKILNTTNNITSSKAVLLGILTTFISFFIPTVLVEIIISHVSQNSPRSLLEVLPGYILNAFLYMFNLSNPLFFILSMGGYCGSYIYKFRSKFSPNNTPLVIEPIHETLVTEVRTPAPKTFLNKSLDQAGLNISITAWIIINIFPIFGSSSGDLQLINAIFELPFWIIGGLLLNPLIKRFRTYLITKNVQHQK